MSSPQPLPRSIRWRIHLGLLSDVANPMVSLSELNKDKVFEQRRCYGLLASKHFHQSSALAIIDDTEKNEGSASSAKVPAAASGRTEIAPSKKQTKVIVDDPLSVMASMEEEKIQAEKKKEMQQKKERAMASRPHHMHHPSAASGPSQGKVTNGAANDTIGSQTRWNEFYSSKEIMDIIYKDLDRLPINHHIYFHQRKTNQVIQITDDNWNPEDSASMKSRQERSKILSEILFVYAKKNAAIGYRQGMHEILSFLLMVIEMDLLQKERYGVNSVKCDEEGVLLNSSKIVHDTYSMFDEVMRGLVPAFETRDENKSGAQSSMELMGTSTMEIIGDWYGDEELVDFITNLGIPPELYCTRWIRLMFSREVEGMDNVLVLWDEFFRQLHVCSESLMKILETAAAAMIILIQDQLIIPLETGSDTIYGDIEQEGDEHVSIHLLMNYPRIQDTLAITETIRKLISNQLNGDRPAKIQRRKRKPSSTQVPLDNCMPPQARQPMMYGVQNQQQAFSDTSYYVHGQNETFTQPTQQQHYQHEQHNFHHSQQLATNHVLNGDGIRSKLKNIKSGPAWARMSNGLNAALKTAAGAVQSIDSSLQQVNIASGSDLSANNFYQSQNSRVSQTGPHFHDELSLGYRDVTNDPIIVEEQINFITQDASQYVESEGSFLGQSNSVHSGDRQVPERTAYIPQEASDLSLQLANRMDKSISSLAKIRLLSNDPEVWNALSELEQIRNDILKCNVSLKNI
mmetsp:Transcript_11710/g.17743  ORF Transcript_11710/g.17743 Transcript_11710/m.17743 type:complete len:742 (-) Transcript_11710:61-2286(-)